MSPMNTKVTFKRAHDPKKCGSYRITKGTGVCPCCLLVINYETNETVEASESATQDEIDAKNVGPFLQALRGEAVQS